MKSRKRTQSGLTLVELIIAVALLGFILLGIAPLFLASVKSNYSADQYTSIHTLARDRLEQLMNLPAGHPQLVYSLTPYPNDLPPRLPDPKTGVPPPDPTGVPNPYTRVYSVEHFLIPPEAQITPNAPFVPTPVAAGAPYNYKRINVTVESGTRPGQAGLLGIGVRRARVSGFMPAPPP